LFRKICGSFDFDDPPIIDVDGAVVLLGSNRETLEQLKAIVMG
jgi:hypothetical protein